MPQEIVIFFIQAGVVLVPLLGAVTLLSLVARGTWPIELLQHFRPHMIAAGLAGTLLFAALFFSTGAFWEWALVALGLAMINYAALPASAWLKPDAALEKAPGLTVVWANVWGKQKPLTRALDWAKTQNADVILIGEYPDGDASAALPGDYPHRVDPGSLPPGNSYARRVVAFSRLPIGDGAVQAGPGPSIRPFVTFTVAAGDGTLDIVGVHPVPPNSPKLLKERDAHIAMLTGLRKGPFVIAGDFNATPWCPGYTVIPGKRVGAYLFKPTWFNSLPLLGLPIDHIMVSPGLKASVYRVSPGLGSDHRALLARVHLPGRAGGP